MRATYAIMCVTIVLAVLSHAQTSPPDLIIHSANIYTADKKSPKADAIAIRSDRIVWIGKTSDIMKMKTAATRVVDAQGATIIPGLHDAHGHFVNLGASLQRLDLRGTPTYDRIVEMVRERAAKATSGEWILGRSWDQNDWPVKEWPTHQKLDAAAPNNPVYLTRVDGHAGLANKMAMDLAGLTRDTHDPPGGRILRDSTGNPTGVLVDGAQDLVRSKIPADTPAQVAEQALLADKECRRLGLTMVHDAGAPPAVVDLYKRLVDEGKLQTRLYVMLRGRLSDLTPSFERGPITNYANHHLVVRAIKIVADGALGSRGAALLEPYSDEPGNLGLLTTPPNEVYGQTLAAAKAGFQACIHAIGDRANRLVLDTFERVQKEVPASRTLRLRVEHAQILDATDIPRFAQLGVIASMQATHCTSDMPWVPARIGPERTAEGAYVWQKLLKSGAVIANGSDFPVEEPNPMLGLYAAITRQDPSGYPPGGWAADQRMSREQALDSFTLGAAYAAHMEKESGSLEAGKLADLVVLSKDIMRVEPKEILTTKVLTTIIGGRIVYEATATGSGGASSNVRRP